MQTSVSDPYSFDPGIRIQGFYNQKLKQKKTAETALEREHLAIQNMKFLSFFYCG